MNPIFKYSNPYIVFDRARKLFGSNVKIDISDKPNKKYKIYDPNNKKWVYFGLIPYQDFTYHGDEDRRRRYLARATNMNGNWRDNPYSANNLSIHLLW